MDATEAALLAREYLDKSVFVAYPDNGFETVDISRSDFKEWEVECYVFSTIESKRVKYKVVISDGKVESATEITDNKDTTEANDQREQYIEDHLVAIRDRQAAELVKSRQYFGEEYEQEHSNE